MRTGHQHDSTGFSTGDIRPIPPYVPATEQLGKRATAGSAVRVDPPDSRRVIPLLRTRLRFAHLPSGRLLGLQSRFYRTSHPHLSGRIGC